MKPTLDHVTTPRKDTGVSSCDVVSQAKISKFSVNLVRIGFQTKVYFYFEMASKPAAACLRWTLLGRLAPRSPLLAHRFSAVDSRLCSSEQAPQKDTTPKVCPFNHNHV